MMVAVHRAGSSHYFHGAGWVLVYGFGSGRARATGNVHGLITGHNISYSGHIWAAFGPHLGRIWATFGPHLGRIWAAFGPHLGCIWAFEAQ